MNQAIDFETDVLVIGTGPTGAGAALALATYGVRVHAVTQWNWLSNGPRGHITNQRTVEIFRDLDIEQEAIQYSTPWELMGDVAFCNRTLAGEELARLRACGTGEGRRSDHLLASPCTNLDLPQIYLEPILVNNAAARGASFSFNTEYLDHEQDDSGVTVRLKDRLSGREYLVRAKYVIGADGGRSRIAEQLGLPFEGHMARAATAYVQFEADLSRHVGHRPSIIHCVVSPDASYGEIGLALFRAIRPWNRWIIGWGFDMATEPDFTDETLKARVRSLVGDPELDVTIKGTSTWYVNQSYATSYAKGRVFCGGDAVHRHPPTNGLGTNTSMQDAYNLAWKLAFVLKGFADETLLESYSVERAPIGRQIVLRANKSRKEFAPLQDAFRAPDGDIPAKLRNPNGEGVAVREALAQALALKLYDFDTHGVELNQRYTSSAVVVDTELGEEKWERDPELYAQATTRPGAKLPHTWLVNAKGRRISTLDLVGKGKFSLVTGLSGSAWVNAAKRLNLPYLRTVVIGDRNCADLYCTWAKLREIDEAGALLVRPDGYIAWRNAGEALDEADAWARLSAAVGAILGEPAASGESANGDVKAQHAK